MIIYAVACGEYSDYSVRALFSSEQLAQEYIDKEVQHEKNEGHSYMNDTWCIEKYTLDECANWEERFIFNVELDALTGDVLRTWEYSDVCSPHDRSGRFSQGVIFPPVRPTGMVRMASFISLEHAIKLAAEARQAWLRAGKPTDFTRPLDETDEDL